jgi:hypothetical protein
MDPHRGRQGSPRRRPRLRVSRFALAALAGFAGPATVAIAVFVLADAHGWFEAERHEPAAAAGPSRTKAGAGRAAAKGDAGPTAGTGGAETKAHAGPTAGTGRAAARQAGARAALDAAAVRDIARGQLRQADRELGACRHKAAAAQRECLRWPLAHLGMASRQNGLMLWTAGDRLPDGPCREVVLGGANAMRLAGQQADLLARSFLDPSVPIPERHRAGRRLITYLREQLSTRAWNAC